MMQSLLFLPFVGAVLGILGVGFYLLISPFLPKEIVIIFVVTFLVLLTGAFEEDALADAVDGFGGGSNREKVLTIMRDSRIGAYGSLALILSIMMEFMFLLHTSPILLPKILFFAMVASRFSALPLIWKMSYIDDSSSFVSAFTKHARNTDGYKVLLLFFIVVLLGWILFGFASFQIIGILLLIVIITGWYYYKRIQGVTGDCLGATLKISELVIIFFGVLWA